jgi:hypothetical protein
MGCPGIISKVGRCLRHGTTSLLLSSNFHIFVPYRRLVFLLLTNEYKPVSGKNIVQILHQILSRLLIGLTHYSIRNTVILCCKIVILEWKFETCFEVMKPALQKYYFYILSENSRLKTIVFKPILLYIFLTELYIMTCNCT